MRVLRRWGTSATLPPRNAPHDNRRGRPLAGRRGEFILSYNRLQVRLVKILNQARSGTSARAMQLATIRRKAAIQSLPTLRHARGVARERE